MRNLSKKQIKTFEEIDELHKETINKVITNRKISEEFIYCARNDLQVAEYLYKSKNNDFNPALVYHIQQAVEKYSKAYSLIFGAVSKKSMREIGHDPARAFIKSIRNTEINRMMKKMGKISDIVYKENVIEPILKINPEKEVENLKELIGSEEINKIEFKDIIEHFRGLRLEIAKKSSRQEKRNFFSFFQKPFDKIAKKIITPEYKRNIIQLYSIEFDIVSFLFPILFIISKHDEFTRYPKLSKKDKYSPKDYVESKPKIISEISRIIDNLKNIDSRFESLLKLVKRYEKRQKKK